jgi:hypothetical protein
MRSESAKEFTDATDSKDVLIDWRLLLNFVPCSVKEIFRGLYLAVSFLSIRNTSSSGIQK